MKITKYILFILALTLFNLSSVMAQDNNLYEERLHSLIDKGVITAEEGNIQLAQINSKKQKNFQRQVRGVASKIKKVKVYEIINEPLEIPSH